MMMSHPGIYCREPIVQKQPTSEFAAPWVLGTSPGMTSGNDMPSLTRFLPPAFAKPRFRIFAAGQAVSVLGSWIQQVALAWLVYRLTDSVFLLGLTGFLLQIPHLFIAPVAGFMIDRLPRVRALIAINAVLGCLAALLAVLVLAGVTQIWPYLTVALLIGIGNACESPARQSLLGAIVEERGLLPSAIGFNSVLFNAGRMIGPAIAGVLLSSFSEGVCFTLNALSFIGIIGALVAMRLDDKAAVTAKPTTQGAVRASLERLWGLPVARYLLPSASAVAFFALPLNQLMPSIAVDFFKGDPRTVGLLLSASGVGALTGALFLSMQTSHRAQLRLVQIGPLVAGLALFAFSFSRSLWLSLPLLAIMGAFVLSTSVSTNTLLQQSVEDSWRGRVIGLYFTFFLGMAPLGNLLAGSLASHIGLGKTLALNGLMMAAAAIIAQLRLRTDPAVYGRLKESVRL